MSDLEFQVAPREIQGKKVAALRRQGITPGNIFGHRIQSQAVQVDTATLIDLLRHSGRNAIINMHVEGEKLARPVMVKGVDRDPTTSGLLHVDFYQVSMREKMHAKVPIVLVGTAPAVSTYGAVLLQSLEHVVVEALPADIPSHIDADVSGMAETDSTIHVRDLVVDPKVTVLGDPDVVVANVAAPRAPVVEEEAERAGEVEVVRKPKAEEAAEES